MDKKDNIGKMGLEPEIDSKSGFCYGVIRAIKLAESFLEERDSLFSLGSIVHNNKEVKRLAEMGMVVIDHSHINEIENTTLFIRAHGEPPDTYQKAKLQNLRIMDCTCPVVIKLQQRIKQGYDSIKKDGGTLLIFGKKGHAEVNGLIGQVNRDAVVVESSKDLDSVNFSLPVVIFSQTTKDTTQYNAIIEEIKERINRAGGPSGKFVAYNTICRQVSSRHPNLIQFSKSHPVILFVSGKESSNGKVLYQACLSANPRSYKIEATEDIDPAWFNKGERVGICGATSTPKWQLEEVAQYIKTL